MAKKRSAKELAEAKARQAKNTAKKSGGSSRTVANSGYGALVDKITKSVLSSAPKEKKPLKDFEKVYNSKLQKEDLEQSKALFEPYYNDKISTILEDLNTTLQMDSISYDRSLRRARASMALSGGAIGSERTTAEGEMQADFNANKTEKVKTAERSVGTERLTAAGYVSAGTPREGTIVGEMKKNIADQQLWYKNQRAQRYYADAGAYYAS